MEIAAQPLGSIKSQHSTIGTRWEERLNTDGAAGARWRWTDPQLEERVYGALHLTLVRGPDTALMRC